MTAHKPDKGKRGGSCNREACQAPGAFWRHRQTGAYYCQPCAFKINDANPLGDDLPLIQRDATPEEIRAFRRALRASTRVVHPGEFA